MTLTPTRAPDHEEFAEPAESLIKEARRQSRRRRFTNGLLVVAIIAAATLVITYGGSKSPSRVPTVPPSRGSGSTTVNDNNAATVPGGQSVLSLWPVGGEALWVDTVNETALSHGAQGIEWTGNGGRAWRNVTPSGDTYGVGNRFIGNFFALSSTKAWVVLGPVEPRRAKSTSLLTTSNAGRTWTRLGPLPLGGCSLSFATTRDGVCTIAPGASNSAPVEVFATYDGGRTWSKIFDNFAGMMSGYSGRDGGLPFMCDKNFTLTSPHTVWVEGWCNATQFFLYRSTDEGRRWSSAIMLPPAAPVEGGAGFAGPVVLSGRRGAVAFQEGRISLVDVTSDGGVTFTPVYPPGPKRPWTTDVVSPTMWRLAWCNEILGTNNGGASWFTIAGNAFASKSVRYSQRWGNGAPNSLHFTSPSFGWLSWNTGSGYTVMSTRDGGKTWNAVVIPGTGKVSAT